MYIYIRCFCSHESDIYRTARYLFIHPTKRPSTVITGKCTHLLRVALLQYRIYTKQRGIRHPLFNSGLQIQFSGVQIKHESQKRIENIFAPKLSSKLNLFLFYYLFLVSNKNLKKKNFRKTCKKKVVTSFTDIYDPLLLYTSNKYSFFNLIHRLFSLIFQENQSISSLSNIELLSNQSNLSSVCSAGWIEQRIKRE